MTTLQKLKKAMDDLILKQGEILAKKTHLQFTRLDLKEDEIKDESLKDDEDHHIKLNGIEVGIVRILDYANRTMP